MGLAARSSRPNPSNPSVYLELQDSYNLVGLSATGSPKRALRPAVALHLHYPEYAGTIKDLGGLGVVHQ